MPAKATPDDNTLFLFTCLKNSDYSSNLHIDFDAVGVAWGGLTRTQAYKRFWNLKKTIEAEGKGSSAPHGVKQDASDTNSGDGASAGATPPAAKEKGKAKDAVGGKVKKRNLDDIEEDGMVGEGDGKGNEGAEDEIEK